MIKIGSKVKLNNKGRLKASTEDEDRIFEVRSNPFEMSGTMCVLLKGEVGGYAVDELTEVDREVLITAKLTEAEEEKKKAGNQIPSGKIKLIDAETENCKLLDFIAEHDVSIQFAIEHKDMTILEEIFSDYFESQKLAYDIDRVLEQLEQLKKTYMSIAAQYDEEGETEKMDLADEKADSYTKAIEIVKAGRIDLERMEG